MNERKAIFRGESGRTEMNFVDSYLYNVAAWELAELLGLADMMPVTVKREWKGKRGSPTGGEFRRCRGHPGELVAQKGHAAGHLRLGQPVQQEGPLEPVGVQQ